MRHSKRCWPGSIPPSRRKSCRDCVASKSRCDLQQPTCGRCRTRNIECEFAAPRDDQDESPAVDTLGSSTTTDSSPIPQGGGPSGREDTSYSPSTLSSEQQSAPIIRNHNIIASSASATTAPPSPGVHENTPSELDEILPEFCISETRRQILLGSAPATYSDSGAVAQHMVSFVVRTLKSWLLLMGSYHTALLPPMIHRVQLEDGLPAPLANCYTLIKMWNGHNEQSRSLVRSSILLEVQRLLTEVSC